MRRIRYLPSFLAAAVCAVLLYCLSVRFPNPLTQVLAPVNASPWAKRIFSNKWQYGTVNPDNFWFDALLPSIISHIKFPDKI